MPSPRDSGGPGDGPGITPEPAPGPVTPDWNAPSGHSQPGTSKAEKEHQGKATKTSGKRGGKAVDPFLIDVAHDSLREATEKARAAAAAADRAHRRADRASAVERRTQAELASAFKAQARADQVAGRVVRLMNANPTGGALLADPAIAGFVTADLAPDPNTYQQQSQTLTNLVENVSDDLVQAQSGVARLEAAQLASLQQEAEAERAVARAKTSQASALRAQKQAKKVFLRLATGSKVSAKEAWWISQFASGDLGRYLASLSGGPTVDMRLARPNDGYITSPFGMRMHPVLHEYKLHSGTDFSGGSLGITAAASGEVVRAGFDVAYGNYVVIWHGSYQDESVATLYAHCATLAVKEGDRIAVGDPIGQIGAPAMPLGRIYTLRCGLPDDPSTPNSSCASYPQP
ncbi:MAG: M23 family metallopeptidase [Actinomycetia bacterium]|nr:M23 family metallopeptidase [Actinomycetes bacterium]